MARETVELTVSGMTCGNCVAHVEKALKSVKGTKNIHVDLDAGRASVDAKPGTRDALLAAVAAAGYEAA